MSRATVPLLVLAALVAGSACAKTWVVCPAGSRARNCHFRGDKAIPEAVERATSGDTIRIRAGRYSPVVSRDVPYKDTIVRAYVLIEGKDLTLAGEAGAALDGSTGLAATAIAVHRARVTIHDLEITGFRYAVEEDDIYDGHGIYVIDGQTRIDNVVIGRFQKMALTGRGDSLLDVSKLQVLDGHVGIWLHETAYLRLRESVVRGNDMSAIAAYDDSAAHISGSVLEGNRNDGLFAQHRATLFIAGSQILRNQRAGASASGESRILIADSALQGNGTAIFTRDQGQVRDGRGMRDGH